MNRSSETTVLVVGADGAGLASVPDALATATDWVVESADRVEPDRLAGVDAVVACDAPVERDGLSAVRTVRSCAPTTPVVLVGREPAPDRLERALDAGAADYVAWDDATGAAALAARLRAQVPDGAAAARWESVIGDVVHDAKNPLNVVSGRVELLDVEESHAEAIERSVDRVASLLDELSTLASLETPLTAVESVSLAEVAADVWNGVDSTDAELAVGSDREIRTERDRLSAILERLFENAVVHGGDGVTVTVGGTDGGFYVADDGPGIPPEDRERVFEQGYSTATYGEGYGLFVVDSAVRAHGWTVSAGESDGGGARFDVTTDR